jgi:spore coat protein CotH
MTLLRLLIKDSMKRKYMVTSKVASGLMLLFVFSFFAGGCDTVTDNNPVNELTSIPVLHVYASQEDLLNMYNNRFTDLEIPATVGYDNSIIKGTMEASGAGSRYFPKYSYKFELDKGQYKNLNTFGISCQVYDKTMIKTALASYLYEMTGFPGFFSEPVFVTINDENKGLYVLTERIDEIWFQKKQMQVYELYQVQFDAKFTFTRRNNVKENFEKEIPEDDNFENLETMINAIDDVAPEYVFTELNKYIDVKEYLRYHAITSVRHDPDAFTNNFFLYKETPGAPFRIIPWDFDKTFDVIGSVGLYGDNDIIKKLFQNDSCRVLYKQYMKDILENVFTEEKLYPLIDQYAQKIKPFYQYDPYLGEFVYEDEVQFLKTFITNRRNYLLGELEKFN